MPTGRSSRARSRFLRRIILISVATALCAAGFGPLPALADPVFNPLKVISDENWRADESLSQAEIQAFLETQAGVLKTYSCAEGGPNGLHSKVVKPASQIIAEAAQYWNVNPKLIIATLQKEQSLITQPYHTGRDIDPTSTHNYSTVYHLTNAMGCGVYAGSPDRHPGFGDQVWTGTQKLGATTGAYAWYPGKTKSVYSYPDGHNITIAVLNQPTWNLYTYTPYYPQYSVWYWYVRFFEDPLSSPIVSVAGKDRVGTAIEASKLAFPAGSESVVITTASNFPDALGGSALAGALHAPILITQPDALTFGILTEIHRLGASRAYILGGTSAISSKVEAALVKEFGSSDAVVRLAGSNRYETARLIADAAVEATQTPFSGTAFIATGVDFPDALAASPLAAAKGWPIYLVDPTAGVDTALLRSLKSAGVKKALVLGGSGVVTDAIVKDLEEKVPLTAERLAGPDRYATALNIATYGIKNAGLAWDKLAIATGEDFPDALAGGVLQGTGGSVMLLTPTAVLDPGVKATLSANKASITEVRCLGGTGAVSRVVRIAISNAL